MYFNCPVNDKSEYNYSKKLYEKELKKVKLLGVKINEEGEENYIWHPEERKICLIDFEYWRI